MSWENQIQGFKDYLQSQKFSPETAHRYSGMLRYFLEWWKNESPENVEYADLLSFIRYCQKEGKSTVRINKYLLAIRHYLDREIKEGKRTTNPATGLQIRGEQQKVKQGLLSRKELNELEKEYPSASDTESLSNCSGQVQETRQIILSLLIHQGLTLAELEKLEPSHLDLNRGTIYIPSGRKSNSRTLKLEAAQIMLLAKAKEQSKTRLISEKPLRNTAFALCRELKEINGKVRNVRHLRASVITDWLRTENLREVQYKSGHKHVVSTEMYLQEHLEGLKEQLKKFHPMG